MPPKNHNSVDPQHKPKDGGAQGAQRDSGDPQHKPKNDTVESTAPASSAQHPGPSPTRHPGEGRDPANQTPVANTTPPAAPSTSSSAKAETLPSTSKNRPSTKDSPDLSAALLDVANTVYRLAKLKQNLPDSKATLFEAQEEKIEARLAEIAGANTVQSGIVFNRDNQLPVAIAAYGSIKLLNALDTHFPNCRLNTQEMLYPPLLMALLLDHQDFAKTYFSKNPSSLLAVNMNNVSPLDILIAMTFHQEIRNQHINNIANVFSLKIPKKSKHFQLRLQRFIQNHPEILIREFTRTRGPLRECIKTGNKELFAVFIDRIDFAFEEARPTYSVGPELEKVLTQAIRRYNNNPYYVDKLIEAMGGIHQFRKVMLTNVSNQPVLTVEDACIWLGQHKLLAKLLKKPPVHVVTENDFSTLTQAAKANKDKNHAQGEAHVDAQDFVECARVLVDHIPPDEKNTIIADSYESACAQDLKELARFFFNRQHPKLAKKQADNNFKKAYSEKRKEQRKLERASKPIEGHRPIDTVESLQDLQECIEKVSKKPVKKDGDRERRLSTCLAYVHEFIQHRVEQSSKIKKNEIDAMIAILESISYLDGDLPITFSAEDNLMQELAGLGITELWEAFHRLFPHAAVTEGNLQLSPFLLALLCGHNGIVAHIMRSSPGCVHKHNMHSMSPLEHIVVACTDLGLGLPILGIPLFYLKRHAGNSVKHTLGNHTIALNKATGLELLALVLKENPYLLAEQADDNQNLIESAVSLTDTAVLETMLPVAFPNPIETTENLDPFQVRTIRFALREDSPDENLEAIKKHSGLQALTRGTALPEHNPVGLAEAERATCVALLKDLFDEFDQSSGQDATIAQLKASIPKIAELIKKLPGISDANQHAALEKQIIFLLRIIETLCSVLRTSMSHVFFDEYDNPSQVIACSGSIRLWTEQRMILTRFSFPEDSLYWPHLCSALLYGHHSLAEHMVDISPNLLTCTNRLGLNPVAFILYLKQKTFKKEKRAVWDNTPIKEIFPKKPDYIGCILWLIEKCPKLLTLSNGHASSIGMQCITWNEPKVFKALLPKIFPDKQALSAPLKTTQRNIIAAANTRAQKSDSGTDPFLTAIRDHCTKFESLTKLADTLWTSPISQASVQPETSMRSPTSDSDPTPAPKAKKSAPRPKADPRDKPENVARKGASCDGGDPKGKPKNDAAKKPSPSSVIPAKAGIQKDQTAATTTHPTKPSSTPQSHTGGNARKGRKKKGAHRHSRNGDAPQKTRPNPFTATEDDFPALGTKAAPPPKTDPRDKPEDLGVRDPQGTPKNDAAKKSAPELKADPRGTPEDDAAKKAKVAAAKDPSPQPESDPRDKPEDVGVRDPRDKPKNDTAKNPALSSSTPAPSPVISAEARIQKNQTAATTTHPPEPSSTRHPGEGRDPANQKPREITLDGVTYFLKPGERLSADIVVKIPGKNIAAPAFVPGAGMFEASAKTNGTQPSIPSQQAPSQSLRKQAP